MPMDLYELMMKRRSIRNFEDRAVPDDIVDRLLDAANNAPTGGNIQPLSIIVVKEAAGREALAEIVGAQPWVKNAPVSFVFCIDFYRAKRWANAFDVDFRGEEALISFLIAYADVMCAAQNVVILAESYGLGSVYVGTILSNVEPARQLLATPKYVLPAMVLSIGYPKLVPQDIPKLNVDAVVHREKYRTPDDQEIRSSFETKYGSIDDDLDRYLERAFIEAVERDRQEQGEGWVDHVKERMKKLEIKSNAEFLFNLRYPADLMVGLNEEMVEAFKDAGFDVALGS
jgi:FMN reductase [NAD(P)H]